MLDLLRQGGVIPAHPLALDADRRLDERHQRALTRYYLDAGAIGVAVAVHTTQFAIHDPAVGLLRPVLELAADTVSDRLLIAGACGPIGQAVTEAELAASLGYHAVLLTPLSDVDEAGLLERARKVGEVLPVIGFYLQPAVGGRHLSRRFWADFAEIETVVAIKVAPFDRYRTQDVLGGVRSSGRAAEIALYTGNDDHILGDLLTRAFAGGLLGQFAVWTHRAVRLVAEARDGSAVRRLLTVDGELTDANGAIFDAANGFAGCLPGIHEVLRRQGLLAGRWCLDPAEDLSPGQAAEIDRIHAAYPHLRDDEFVAANLDRWLA